MDAEDFLCFFWRATQQDLDFCVSLFQIHGADDGRDLSVWQTAQPDIDASAIRRPGVLQVSIVQGVEQRGVARMRRALRSVDLEPAGSDKLIEFGPKELIHDSPSSSECGQQLCAEHVGLTAFNDQVLRTVKGHEIAPGDGHIGYQFVIQLKARLQVESLQA
jgi:hypothetical protein